MLPDPIEINYETVDYELPRVGSSLSASRYLSSDTLLSLYVATRGNGKSGIRHEVTLTENVPNPTPDPFSNESASVPISFGIVVDTDSISSFADKVPELRTALLNWLDQDDNFARIMSGES
jgi:hypothetical protein